LGSFALLRSMYGRIRAEALKMPVNESFLQISLQTAQGGWKHPFYHPLLKVGVPNSSFAT
jgi:hypothetical protein